MRMQDDGIETRGIGWCDMGKVLRTSTLAAACLGLLLSGLGPASADPSHVRQSGLVKGRLGATAAATLSGTLVFIRGDDVWISRADGGGARALTHDGTDRWPYRSPSQDDAGHVLAIAGGASHDAKLVRMDQRGAVLARFAPPIESAYILFAQVSPDGRKLAYGALFGASDCADFDDCYTFFDHTVHYGAASSSSKLVGSGEATDVSWATWAGNDRTILESSSMYKVEYEAPSDSDGRTWFEACQNFDEGCNNEDHFQFQPTVSRQGDRYAASEEVLPWNSDLPSYAYLEVLPTSNALTADPPPAPGTGCLLRGPAPLTEFPGHDQLTVVSPSFSPDGRAVAFGLHDGKSPDEVAVALLPDLSDCSTASATVVLVNASQPFWSPAALSSPVAPRLRFAGHRPAVVGKHKVGKRLHLSATTSRLRRAFAPDARSVAYQWLRNGHPIRHAHGASYRLVRKDRHDRIAIRITGHRTAYRDRSVTTSAVRIH